MKKRKQPIVAAAQIKYFEGYSKNNLSKIKRYINLAKQKNADIVCFPESCVHKTATLHKNHKLIKEIREECRKHSIWCIITEDLKIKRKTYNTALLIDRKGRIHGGYKKINLYGDEVTPGKKIEVFKTDFAKVGIAICWDLAFPELFKKMKKAGVEIVFCPAQWWYDTEAHKQKHKEREFKILESLARTRAYENICFLVLCNPVMDSKRQISYSAIISPTRVLAEIRNKEGLITAKLNLNKIKKLQKVYNS